MSSASWLLACTSNFLWSTVVSIYPNQGRPFAALMETTCSRNNLDLSVKVTKLVLE